MCFGDILNISQDYPIPRPDDIHTLFDHLIYRVFVNTLRQKEKNTSGNLV